MNHYLKMLASLLLMTFSLAAWGQQDSYICTGVVKDNEGNPVPGAAVMVQGGASVITDIDGAFSVKVSSGSTVNFSCLGYADVSVAVNGRN